MVTIEVWCVKVEHGCMCKNIKKTKYKNKKEREISEKIKQRGRDKIREMFKTKEEGDALVV